MLHIGHMRSWRPVAQPRQQLFEADTRPFGHNFHTAVVAIDHPAGEVQRDSLVACVKPETHPLNTAADRRVQPFDLFLLCHAGPDASKWRDNTIAVGKRQDTRSMRQMSQFN